MKALLSAVAFGALLSIAVAYLPIEKEPAWLGKMPGTAIPAKAINCGIEINFSKELRNDAVIFSAELKTEDKPEDLPDSKTTIAIELNNGEEFFWGLETLGFKKDSEENVRIVLRFRKSMKARKNARIEILITELPAEEADTAFKEENFFTFINALAFRNMHSYPSTPFDFKWLEKLVSHGLVPVLDPFHLEGYENEADSYKTRSILLSADALKELRSVVWDDTKVLEAGCTPSNHQGPYN